MKSCDPEKADKNRRSNHAVLFLQVIAALLAASFITILLWYSKADLTVEPAVNLSKPELETPPETSAHRIHLRARNSVASTLSATSEPPPEKATAPEVSTGLASALHKARHAFTPINPTDEHSRGASFFTANPSQQIRAWIRKDGIELATGLPTTENREPWSVNLRLATFGRTDATNPVSPDRITAKSTRTESTDGLSGLTQWFENRKAGIEHGFTLASSPEGVGEIEITMAVDGTVSPIMRNQPRSDNKEEISFVEPDGTVAVNYVGLKAWDATGRTLDSSMFVHDRNIVLKLNDEGALYPLTIDPLFASPQARLTGNSAFVDAYFGESVSISGDLAIIGSHQEDTPSGANSGAAYTFVRNGALWAFQGKVTATDGDTGDEFGRSVALDGATAIVGAPSADSIDNIDQGKAYVFFQSDSGWTEQAILHLTAGDAEDHFGLSVSISGDTAMVGAPGFDIAAGEDAGSVSFFIRSGSTWTLQQTLESTDPGEEFGFSSAIESNKAVSGAHLSSTSGENQAGRAYVLSRAGNSWIVEATLEAPTPRAANEFGYSVALSGNTILVGVLQGSKAYAFVENDSSWELQKVFSNSAELFGISVAISDNTAVVGAQYDSSTGDINAGGTYVYIRNSNNWWTLETKLEAGDSSAFDLFGRSVSISDDTILVGAPFDDTSTAINAGSAYFFERSVSTWSEQSKVTSGESGATGLFGFSTDLSGQTAVVGAPLEDTTAGVDAGVSYIFVRQEGDIWSQETRLTSGDAAANDHFGNSVAISGDYLVVGAKDDDTELGTDSGSVYFFTRLGNEWTQRQKISGENGTDEFGDDVAIDGNLVIVGAPDLFTLIPPTFGPVYGGGYAYRWTGTALTLETILLPDEDRGVIRLGDSVAISGQTAVLGATFADTTSASRAGAAFIFTRSDGSWSEQAKLSASDGLEIDQFGKAVAIDDGIVVIGAETGDTNAKSDSGSAYVFERNGDTWTQTARLAPSTIAAGDVFGYSVGVSGTTVVVSAPSTSSPSGEDVGNAYVFQKSGLLWNQQATLSAGINAASTGFFGGALALENNTVVIGAPGEDSSGEEASGALYVFLIGELPVIVEQPKSRTVPLTDPGTPTNFTVRVSGYAPISYQWRKNGINITEAEGVVESDTVTYKIAETSEADKGIYDVVITNVGGVTTSAPAELTVNVLSEFSQQFPPTPPDSNGFLLVSVSPSNIGGAWRFQGEQTWRQSGIPVFNLTTADRVIEFRPVPGHIQPPAETISIVSGQVTPTVNAQYYLANSSSSTGSLSVTLKPDSIASSSVPIEERAQWRFLVVPGAPADPNNPWRNSGDSISNLSPGTYLIECKDIPGRTTPAPVAVAVDPASAPAPIITYLLRDFSPGTQEPTIVPFETVSTADDLPYHFVGQIRSNLGSATGFAVYPRVVLTAAHTVFDEVSLSVVPNVQWLPQRDVSSFEPEPLTPRGVLIETGYADQRTLENTPGTFSPESRVHDVAALYFESDAARGSTSGWLASDLIPNEWLTSDEPKTLVGYPVEGIPANAIGRMHATPFSDLAFTQLGDFSELYITTDIRSYPGNSGGPLCIQFTNTSDETSYYPAGIYLGGLNEAIVRTFDSAVLELIESAQNRALDPENGNVGGGITLTEVSSFAAPNTPGRLEILIEPEAAREAGAGWRLNPESTFRTSGSRLGGLHPGTYSLELPTIEGFKTPPIGDAEVTGGVSRTYTFTYEPNLSEIEQWRIDNFGSPENSGMSADTFDFDQDGQNNLAEFIAGTDPSDPNDLLQINTISRIDETITITLKAKQGRTYQLQRWTPNNSQDINPAWISIQPSQSPEEGSSSLFFQDNATVSDKTFYRIQVSTLPKE